MEENSHGKYTIKELEGNLEVPVIGLKYCLVVLRRYAGPTLSICAWIIQLNLVGLIWNAAHRTHVTSIVAFFFLAVYIITLVAKFAEEGWRYMCHNPFRRPRLRLIGNKAPQVDLIITTCGEDLDMICDTVAAACALNYPSDRFRVLVSDDGASPVLRTAITRLSKTSPPKLLYFARPATANGKKQGAKSGNMNAALAYFNTLGEAAEYAAMCDADMILEPDFLRACVPQLIADPDAAIAVVPQFFYNIPRNDPLNQSLNTQGRSDGAQRDSIQCAWNTGPGAVFRRQAFNTIGGFPEDALCEDVMTGWLMNGQGWHNIQVPEEMQWGLQPDTLVGHVAQRCKWSVGMVRNARTTGFGFNKKLLPKMTWRQRAICFTHCASPYFVLWKFLRIWLTMAMMVTGQPLITPANSQDLRKMVTLSWMLVCIARIEDILGGMSSGFATMRRRKQGGWWLMPYQFSAIVHELLPIGWGGRRLDFVPTAISESSVRERDASCRPWTFKHVISMIGSQGLLSHVVLLAMAGTVLISIGYRADKANPTSVSWSFYLTHAWVPGCDWETILCFLTPLTYAVSPPTMPPRRKLMYFTETKSETGGFWRPKPTSKMEKWDTSMLFHELPHFYVFMVWTGALFLANY